MIALIGVAPDRRRILADGQVRVECASRWPVARVWSVSGSAKICGREVTT
jgi:hypothetical protein